MTKAEERALEAYPPTFTSGKRYAKRVQSEKVDTHAPIRSIFIKGYEQAEKDLALTWEDMQFIWQIFDILHEECMVYQPDWMFSSKSFYTEALKRFKEAKK